MNKRYIRIDIEYEGQEGFSWREMNVVKYHIEHNLPYMKVIFSRDSPDREGLNEDHHEVERMIKKENK